MVVGTGVIVLRIEGCRSLKEKRKVVKSMTVRMANAFNISVSETGSHDIYQKAEIGFAVVGNDRRVVNAQLDKIFNMAETLCQAEITYTDMEIISL